MKFNKGKTPKTRTKRTAPKNKKKGGRPTKITEQVVKKLEHAFSLGCSDKEACIYANISKQTLYSYQDKNKGFLDRKIELKETPILMARMTVINALKKSVNVATWYLERKKKDEFSAKTEMGLSEETLKLQQKKVEALQALAKLVKK